MGMIVLVTVFHIAAEYFGAYAQTELGHGSNVRALETTAEYDKTTKEFVINSPTLTSMKWWPTGMYASTHGVVFAQLILDGKKCGVFGFFMQFRDEDGVLMPGVEIGEIGPKLGKSQTSMFDVLQGSKTEDRPFRDEHWIRSL